jgi:tRNA 2-thiouridine synthesizing protein E
MSTALQSALSSYAPVHLGAAFDADGFLLDGADWTRALAEALAREEGVLALTPEHWALIELVRRRFHAMGALPVMRRVCRAAGLDAQRARGLFSGCRSLWRIAGLPHPGEEAVAYMH